MLELIVFTALFIAAAVVGLGVGTIFFGKMANREACGTVPEVKSHEDCPSQKAGLCPVLDETGTVKLASRARISYPKHSK